MAPPAVVRRFVDEYQSRHDVAAGETLLAADFVDHSPFGPFPPDRNGVLALFGALFAAFPDLRAEIHHQVTEGDLVATSKTFHGTHDGEFMGIAPTGREIAFDVFDLVRVRDGRLVEHWNVVDAMALMTRSARSRRPLDRGGQTASMPARFSELIIDANDVDVMADFWSAVLGWERRPTEDP